MSRHAWTLKVGVISATADQLLQHGRDTRLSSMRLEPCLDQCLTVNDHGLPTDMDGPLDMLQLQHRRNVGVVGMDLHDVVVSCPDDLPPGVKPGFLLLRGQLSQLMSWSACHQAYQSLVVEP